MINHSAVRAYNNILNPLLDLLARQEEADNKYDAGEFGGDFYHDLEVDIRRQAAREVAARFAVEPKQIVDWASAAYQEQSEKYLTAIGL